MNCDGAAHWDPMAKERPSNRRYVETAETYLCGGQVLRRRSLVIGCHEARMRLH